MVDIYHYPVMYRDVLRNLDIPSRQSVLDCTLGMGSLSYKMLEAMPAQGILYGIDKDIDSLELATRKLNIFGNRAKLFKADFSDIDKVVEHFGVKGFDAIILDLGISSYQLNNGDRGFSFSQGI